jgi:hypothetical protein
VAKVARLREAWELALRPSDEDAALRTEERTA